jgi:two-component system nitrate/nitrite response regulator NarL
MVRSLSLVHGGERVMPRELMQSIAARSQDGRERHTRSTVSRPGSSQAPSPREAEILQRLLQGHPNKTIALQLGITETTVKVHLKSLLRKVNASNRTQAAVWALNNGYTAHGSAFGGTGPEGGMKPNEINDYGQHNGSLMGSRRGKPH